MRRGDAEAESKGECRACMGDCWVEEAEVDGVGWEWVFAGTGVCLDDERAAS